MSTGIEYVNAGQQASGPVAQTMLAGGMDISTLRPFFNDKGASCVSVMQNGKPAAKQIQTNAILRKDEWKTIDDGVMQVQRERLIGVNDLVNAGLTYNLSNPMASTVLEFEKMDDPGEAQMDMDGINRGNNARPRYSMAYLPIPIIHSDFQFNSRVLAASRTRGDPVDTTQSENASRRVAEYLEGMLFTDPTDGPYSFGTGTIYGYVNHPDRIQKTLNSWTGSSKTGEDIVADLNSMKQGLISKQFFGPYMVYVPAGYETILDEDYVSNYPKTIRQRILEINNIQDIKVADHLAADTVIMVQMTSNVVRLVDGMANTSVQWESEGGMALNFKVMSIRVPQIRSDINGACGVVHATA